MTLQRLLFLPLLILSGALSVTWVLWEHERQTAKKELQAQFNFSLREAVSRVEQRMAAYEQMLLGVQSLLVTSGVMERDNLHDYVASLNLHANFSGVQAIGVSVWVPAAHKESHVNAMHQRGISNYAILPDGERDHYAPIVQREPDTGLNRITPGFDPWSDPVRRAAMEKSRDSGMVAISGKVRLNVDVKADSSPGFIMYLPIYARGQTQHNVAARRAHLTGWVYASFHMNELMATLYGEQPPGLALTIYDGVEPSATTLLYPSSAEVAPPRPAVLSANEYLVVAGHSWTLSLNAMDEFKARYGRNAEWLIGTAGIGLSLLLALLASLLTTGRRRAMRLASRMTSELRKSEEKLRAIADNVNSIMFLKDLTGKYLYVNRQYERLFHISNADIQGKTDYDIFPPDQAKIYIQNDQQVIRSGLALEVQEQVLHDDGVHAYLSVKVPIRDITGKIYAVCGISTDNTERKQVEADLRIAAFTFESQEGVMITDANNVILRVNQAFTASTGYTAAEAVGQTPSLLRSGHHNAEFFQAMWDSIHQTGGWQGEIWDRRKNGDIYPKWLTISAIKDNTGTVTHYIAAHHDITDRKKAEKKIEELAFFDALTHLPNRTLLMDRLKQAMTTGNRNETFGAVLFIDLDNFKTLNDTLGHDKGDLLLQQVARRLSACVREGDTVARLGGDEFVVILESLNTNPQEAATQIKAVAEKILAHLNQPYQFGTVEHRNTASIGATLFCGHATPIDELLKQADLAMYKAKETGRNAVRFFDPAMQSVVIERAALEKSLRLAVQENQFELHYQAQVVDEGRVTGAEALVRWHHPERGLVPPAEFIPLAEETGLILPLGQWVLETACTQLARWASQPALAHLTVAVNVSAHQFREPDFVAKVLAVLEQTGANPHRLKLELTESLLVHNVPDIIGKMHALKAQGVSFSLDDFGTGYSSLSYLKRMPLDQLKIDQGFVSNILTDQNDAAIAKMVIALAESLGLSVIAEGVETPAQRDFLAHSGCLAYQGYFCSKPVPLAAFEAYARQRNEEIAHQNYEISL